MASLVLMEVWDSGSKIRGEFKHPSNQALDGCVRLDVPISYSLSGSGAMDTSSGVGGGAVHISDVSFSQTMNTASPRLMERCALGKPLEKVIIHFFSGGANELVEVMTLHYSNVYVTHYSVNSMGGEGLPKETLSLGFQKFYVSEKEVENGQLVSNASYGWDIVRNQEWTAS